MPTPGAIANRRLLLYLLFAFGLLSFFFLSLSRHSSSPNSSTFLPSSLSPSPSSPNTRSSLDPNPPPPAYAQTPIHHVAVEQSTLSGGAIMPKLGNETLKAELGRAAWKLFHTTMARFPDAPTEDEKTALFSYIHLFARLYPCGECAGHFRQILEFFPPQVATRSVAAVWACHVHNEVNKSLGKAEFDCSKIGDFYDCGCADDGEEENKEGKGKKWETAHEREAHLRVEREPEQLGG